MNELTRQKLARWLDHESVGDEASEIEALLKADPEARQYLEDLQRVSRALSTTHLHPSRGSPEWKQVRNRLTAPTGPSPRELIPFPRVLAAMAAILVAGMILWLPLRDRGVRQDPTPVEVSLPPVEVHQSVEMVETDLVGATSIVYLDQPSGWTVVWVIPPEEGVGI